jgi:hypothetical protein
MTYNYRPIFILSPLLFSFSLQAQTVKQDLTGLGMKSELAEYFASILPGGAVLDNNTYLKATDQAGSGQINILKVDSGDNTLINSSASDELILQLEDDASRLIRFTASSDAALVMKYGDAGTTATQQLTISASTSDADDDSTIIIAGGGAKGTGDRGSWISLPGEEVAGGSDVEISAGASDEIQLSVADTPEVTIKNDELEFSATGKIDATSTSLALAIADTAELTLTDNQIALSGAAFEIVPGATSFSVRNNADAQDNLLISNAGAVTSAAGITATTGNITSTAGNLVATADSKGLVVGAGTFDADVTGVSGVTPILSETAAASTGHAAFVGTGASASPSSLYFFKTRAAAGSTDANTIVNSGDDISSILFFGADGTSYREAARITTTVDATPGASDMPGRMVFSVTPDGSATVAEAMRISNDKSVSIADKITSSRTSDLGWAVVAGANTACNTTCTSACVFGVNTAATEADIVGCADATADECLCAGAS